MLLLGPQGNPDRREEDAHHAERQERVQLLHFLLLQRPLPLHHRPVVHWVQRETVEVQVQVRFGGHWSPSIAQAGLGTSGGKGDLSLHWWHRRWVPVLLQE